MARSCTPHCRPIRPRSGTDPRPHPRSPPRRSAAAPHLLRTCSGGSPEHPSAPASTAVHDAPHQQAGPDRLPRHVGRTRHERTAFLGCIFRPCRRRTHPRRAAPTDHQVGRQTPATRRDTTKTQRAEESPCQPKPLSHIDTNLYATLIRTHRHRPRSSPSTTADPSKGLHEETRIVTLAGNEQDFGPT